MLADLAVRDPQAFSALVQTALAALGDEDGVGPDTSDEGNVDEAVS
jgi:hypothetical protein